MASIKVSGMSCGHCVASVTKALEEMANISKVRVDLTSGTVEYETTGDVPLSDIKATIVRIGFTPED